MAAVLHRSAVAAQSVMPNHLVLGSSDRSISSISISSVQTTDPGEKEISCRTRRIRWDEKNVCEVLVSLAMLK